MNKKDSYSKRALSTIEIVSSYFVNIYYNCLYQEAKRLHIDSRVESVTTGYKHAIKAYINSFDNPDLYRKIVSGIHKYYHTTTRFTSISFSDCINEIVKHFIPDAFFDSITNTQKDSILRVILLNSVKKFSSDVICSDMLSIIIDTHTDYGISRRMQDCMVQALIFEREKMFQKIFSTSTETQDSTGFAMVTRLKQELVKIAREKYIVECKHNKIKAKALDLIKLTKEYKQNITTVEKERELLQKQLENYKKTTSVYQQERDTITSKQLEKENILQSNKIKELETYLQEFKEKEAFSRKEKEDRRQKKKNKGNINTIINNTATTYNDTILDNKQYVSDSNVSDNQISDNQYISENDQIIDTFLVSSDVEKIEPESSIINDDNFVFTDDFE